MRIAALCLMALATLAGCATPSAQTADDGELRRQVFATERAFAKTMADRDFAAFKSFLSADC